MVYTLIHLIIRKTLQGGNCYLPHLTIIFVPQFPVCKKRGQQGLQRTVQDVQQELEAELEVLPFDPRA